jgi:CheY-like chemotaxis protein
VGSAIPEALRMTWRVLVADDDPVICTLIKAILGRGPYDVTSCNDAESALVHIGKDEPYDILISDFMLPGISGIDLITQLRQNRAMSRMPVVMISGHNNYAMGERAREAGANAFLNKPFTAAQLRTIIQQLLTDPLSVMGR